MEATRDELVDQMRYHFKCARLLRAGLIDYPDATAALLGAYRKHTAQAALLAVILGGSTGVGAPVAAAHDRKVGT